MSTISKVAHFIDGLLARLMTDDTPRVQLRLR